MSNTLEKRFIRVEKAENGLAFYFSEMEHSAERLHVTKEKLHVMKDPKEASAFFEQFCKELMSGGVGNE